MAMTLREHNEAIVRAFSVPPAVLGHGLEPVVPTEDYGVSVRLIHDLWLRGGFGQPINSAAARNAAARALDALGEPWQ